MPDPFALPQELHHTQAAALKDIHGLAASLHAYLEMEGSSRELQLAKTKLEEAVQWAELHVRRNY